MSCKQMSLVETITEMIRTLKNHIGSNGNSHLPVNLDSAGFMTPEMLEKHNGLFNKRIHLPYGTDILSLKPGFYEGSQFINHPVQPTTPTPWITNVDVTRGGDGRKQIRLIDNLKGSEWTRTIHSDDTPESGTGGWARVWHEQSLWQGHSTGTVTLSRPVRTINVDNYDRILVRGGTEALNGIWYYGSVNSGVTINMTNNSNSNSAVDIMEAYLSFPTDTTAQLSGNKHSVISAASASDTTAHINTSDGIIYIEEIIGLY